ncbi:glycosyltransferase [soil metagenome]
MRACVIVPSYRRPGDLARCLAALRVQQHAPAQVIVSVREGDDATRLLLDELALAWPELRRADVARGGVVAAMNAALALADADVIALTDDDAEPVEDWLQRMVAVFESGVDVGGVGGRDDQARAPGELPTVGRLQWFGRVIGNHHLGVGPARDVDVLKGVCCAFRAAPLRGIGFDERLRGAGAQVHWELSLCLALRRAGWRLVYDPAIRVRHHVAIRHDSDQLHRGRFDAPPHEDAVFNETLVLAEYLTGLRRVAFRVWTRVIGTAAEPGLLQLPRVLIREGRVALVRWRATQRARHAGFAAASMNGLRRTPSLPTDADS